jgi:acyl-coenzyme A synthetase/AMP-(fatty) acid ligase
MPKTMSGKIRKVDLRQSLADRAEGPPAPATKA